LSVYGTRLMEALKNVFYTLAESKCGQTERYK
jgi:hypothetical protein